MQKQFVNTFTGGLDRDTSINKYDNTHMYDCQNFTLMHRRELSNQALVSISGSLAKANISGDGVSIRGTLILREYVIMFVKTPEGGKIYRFEDYGSSVPEAGELTLIYEHEDLIFDDVLDIVGVGRYESDDIQKIYFTDGKNFFYHMNIVHDPLTNPLIEPNKIPVASLDLVSDVTFDTIDYEIESGGNLRAGRIQYAYQLYNVNGAETVFSPTSSLINLTAYDDNDNSTLDYLGSPKETNVNKSVKLTIAIQETTFIRLRVVAIQYDSDIVLPSVRIVGEYNITNLASVTITDTGQLYGSYTLDELRFIQQNIIPKTLESKDNILFAGNIEEDYFYISDTDFDSRAYRFNPAGTCVLNQAESGDANSSERTVQYDNIAGAGVPIQHACYNVFNNLDKDIYRYSAQPGSNTTDYRYKITDVGGVPTPVLGGQGANISFEFITVPKIIDTEPQREGASNILLTHYGYPKLQVVAEAPFENYANYKTAAEYTGYQRDEIYAFAIVFFDLKGRPSFAKWIADIRFPDNDTHPFITYDTQSQFTIANVLGINFTVDIPVGIEPLISGYQIVRCERRDTDKTVKAAGLFAYPYLKSADKNQMYSVSTVPRIGDCAEKKIVTARWTVGNTIAPWSFATPFLQSYKENSLPLTDKFIDFSSPEISFNKKITSSSTDILEVVGSQEVLSNTAIADRRASDSDDRRAIMASDKFKSFTAYPKIHAQTYNLPFTRIKPDTVKVFTQIDSQFNAPFAFPDGFIYSKQTYNGRASNRNYGLRGTHMFCSRDESSSWYLPDDFSGKSGSTYGHKVMYGYYRQNAAKGIYGGTDHSTRKNRTYYKASEFIHKDRTTTVISTDTITNTVVTIGAGTPVADQTFVTFESNMPGSSNQWVINIVLPAVAIEDTTFEIGWVANRVDVPGPSMSFSASLLVTAGYDQASSVELFELTQDNSENWYISEQYVLDVTPSTQYSVSGELLENSYTTEVTVVETTIPGIVVFGGDTYIGYHIDYRSFWDMTRSSNENTGRYSIKSITMYPVESTINLSLRTDDIQGFITWHAHHNDDTVPPPLESEPKYHLQEKLTNGISMWGINYPTDFGDMYQYNKAYSAMDKTKLFIPEPFDFRQRNYFDTRVYASQLKINGEYTDSWLKFKANSFIDVDSAYGRLVRLYNIANRLMFFQPDGIGVLSVNERALLQDNNAAKLTVGTGGILPRFDYVSYTTGIQTHDAVIKADSTFFYVDAQRKRIYTHQGADIPVSAVKGVNSLLQTFTYDSVQTGFERDFNRVYFTIDGVTFIFNEFANAFTHRLSVAPDKYISLGNGFYTLQNEGEERPLLANDLTNVDYNDLGDPILIADSTVGTTLFKHSTNPTGVIDGDETSAESFVEIIIHPSGVTKCMFSVIELTMEVIDNNGNEVFTEEIDTYQPVFDSIKDVTFTNSYMTKTVVMEFNKTIKKIGKTWRVQVPLVADRKVPTRSTRFVDTYLKVKITYDNSGANRLRLHDIITYYTPISV